MTANLIFGALLADPLISWVLSTELNRTGLFIKLCSGKADMAPAEPAIPFRKFRRSTPFFFIESLRSIFGAATDYHFRYAPIIPHRRALADGIHLTKNCAVAVL